MVGDPSSVCTASSGMRTAEVTPEGKWLAKSDQAEVKKRNVSCAEPEFGA